MHNAATETGPNFSVLLQLSAINQKMV